MNKDRRGLKTFGIIATILLLFVVVIAIIANSMEVQKQGQSVAIHPGENYIAQIKVDGVIASGVSYFDTGTIYYDWIMNEIDVLAEDENNKGILLLINSPGGGTYESDEIYQKLMNYKKVTGRPVYAYIEQMGASGGYYIASAANKIYANRNALTGSIGVKLSTFYDVSELLSRYGIKTQNITSGANKNMGDFTTHLTDEQKDIYQSIVDEAYEQFVSVVAEGRSKTVEEIKPLADGRIYTAKQAEANGLIDGVSSLDQVEQEMINSAGIDDGCEVELIEPTDSVGILDHLLLGRGKGSLNNFIKKIVGEGELDSIEKFMNYNNEIRPMYLAG